MLKEVLLHVAKNPKDTVYLTKHENHLQVAKEMGLQADESPSSQSIEEQRLDVTGKCFAGHLAGITSMELETQLDGREVLVSADRDEKVRVSSAAELWRIHAILTGHKDFVVGMCRVKDLMCTAGADKTLRLTTLC